MTVVEPADGYLCVFAAGTVGEWTEVASKKKMKLKKDGAELTQEQRATSEPADELLQVLTCTHSFNGPFPGLRSQWPSGLARLTAV